MCKPQAGLVLYKAQAIQPHLWSSPSLSHVAPGFLLSFLVIYLVSSSSPFFFD